MRSRPEQDLHLAVAELLERFAEPGVEWWHTDNNSSSAKRGALLKRMGVKAGVADFVLFTIPQKMPSFLELKSAKGKLSEAQLRFGLAMKLYGCRYEIARTLDEATDYLRDIGALRQIDIRRRAAA